MRQYTISCIGEENGEFTQKLEQLKTATNHNLNWLPYIPDQNYDCVLLCRDISCHELETLSQQIKKILWLKGYEFFTNTIPDNVEIFPHNAPLQLLVSKLTRTIHDFNENHSLAVKTTTNAIMIYDAEGKPLWANLGFTTLYGITFEEFCQRYKTFHEASVIENPEQIIEQLKQNQVVRYQSWYVNPNNRKIWLQTSITPVCNSSGILDRFVVVETDITSLKEVEKELENQKILLEEERQHSDNLLHNILPKEVALKLKKGKVKPKLYKSVSIMFIDFKGFSKLCRTYDSLEIVEQLDYLITSFDDIIGKHFLEKIKTIGDAYMCVGGLPMKNNSHRVNIILAALEIQQFLWEFNKPRILNNQHTWDCRIGIHTGEVIAGVVGKKKFAYDIWGDAVNIAARIEQSGVINSINISSSTYEPVKDYFECIPRGYLEAKNIGQIEMYFVTGLNPEYATDSTLAFPNEKFSDILRKM